VENYTLIAKSVAKVDFQVLERHNVPVALHTTPFELIKCVGVLFYSFSNHQLTRIHSEHIGTKLKPSKIIR
jgi:hypothetical protein